MDRDTVASGIALVAFIVLSLALLGAVVAGIDYFFKNRNLFAGSCIDGYKKVEWTTYYSGVGLGPRMLGLYGNVTNSKCVPIEK